MYELMIACLELDELLLDKLSSGSIGSFSESDLQSLRTALSRIEVHRDKIADHLEYCDLDRVFADLA